MSHDHVIANLLDALRLSRRWSGRWKAKAHALRHERDEALAMLAAYAALAPADVHEPAARLARKFRGET